MAQEDAQRLDLRLVQKLVRIMTRADLSEVEVDDTTNGLRIHLRRGPLDAHAGPLVNVLQGGAAPSGAAMPMAGLESGQAPAPGAAGPPAGTETFNSPMVGTFYRASAPDAEPFVEVGAKVDEETTLCIVEAMKVMNEIKAELRGEILEILVANGEPVEFGQPMFLIKKY